MVLQASNRHFLIVRLYIRQLPHSHGKICAAGLTERIKKQTLQAYLCEDIKNSTFLLVKVLLISS